MYDIVQTLEIIQLQRRDVDFALLPDYLIDDILDEIRSIRSFLKGFEKSLCNCAGRSGRLYPGEHFDSCNYARFASGRVPDMRHEIAKRLTEANTAKRVNLVIPTTTGPGSMPVPLDEFQDEGE